MEFVYLISSSSSNCAKIGVTNNIASWLSSNTDKVYRTHPTKQGIFLCIEIMKQFARKGFEKKKRGVYNHKGNIKALIAVFDSIAVFSDLSDPMAEKLENLKKQKAEMDLKIKALEKEKRQRVRYVFGVDPESDSDSESDNTSDEDKKRPRSPKEESDSDSSSEGETEAPKQKRLVNFTAETENGLLYDQDTGFLQHPNQPGVVFAHFKGNKVVPLDAADV